MSIAGYTNAGKSSLLNRLTGAGLLVDDALFATLDPTTRRTQHRATDGSTRSATPSASSGTCRTSWSRRSARRWRRSADSDLILHVVDGAHPDPEGQLAAVREVLAEIGADRVPEIVVVNKSDAADPMVLARLLRPGAARGGVLGPHRRRHRRRAGRRRAGAAAPAGAR